MRNESLLTINKNIEQAMKKILLWIGNGLKNRDAETKEHNKGTHDIENGRDDEMTQEKRNWVRGKNVNLSVTK